MDKMIAFCGLSCTGCDAFPVNQKKMTANERTKVAEKWTMLQDMDTLLNRKIYIVMAANQMAALSFITAVCVK